MIERIVGGYDNFVLPFMIGMYFIFAYLAIAIVRLFMNMPKEDLKKFLLSLINPKILLKDIKDIIFDCLLHVKIFKRNILLGYMHASIAFGWFMIIVIGHIEVLLYVPQKIGRLYYPIFFRYFVKQQGDISLKGAFFFFLMDFFLLVILSGVGLAMYKRIRSTALGMRRTTKPCFADRVALICLWSIFPLRLLAESFTAGIAGGSFLTIPMHWLFASFLSNDYHILPTWWAYSTALGLFFICLPFSRYMHIPTEALFILLRNAGLKIRHPRKGFAEAQIYSCSSCGLCIDACPMNIQKKNLPYSTVYFTRAMRRNSTKKINTISDKCLMCGKCVAVCPVGVDSCSMKTAQRATVTNSLKYDYSYINNSVPAVSTIQDIQQKEKVLYFAGCMTQLTPTILKSMVSILESSNTNYQIADKDGGLCCGRPLLLSGKLDAAKEVIAKNTQLIKESGCTTLLLSCPICMKVFKEDYNLKEIKIIHHTQFIDTLIKEGKIKVTQGTESMVFHTPCELGRGCGVYQEPLNVINSIGELKKAEKEGKESVCCGGSLGSLTLNYEDRTKITQGSLKVLTYNNPDKIITACPLCLKTFKDQSNVPVLDIAQAVCDNMKQK